MGRGDKRMMIKERMISDIALVQVSGRVTVTDGSADFDAALQRLIRQGNIKLIIDVGEVPYIDSTALGAMLRAHATVIRLGGTLKLLHVRGHVRELLELTRLLPVFEAFDSEDRAIAGVTSIRSQEPA
jgi:anti-sigma B factor antagonist